jgi:CubicO group peptidase (beta-lactamase class C family)
MTEIGMTAAAPAQARAESPFAHAYGVLADAVAARAFPGCAFGVLAHGSIVLHDALGASTYEDDAFPIEPATVYDIIAMLLVQRGVLDVDTPLGELLPGFVVGRSSGERARHVTLRHLLAHNSGLPGYVEFFHTASSPDALLRACLQLPLEAEPGTRFMYSDPGFILLGKALEVLIREPLDSFIHREICAPLQLDATRYNPRRSATLAIPPTEEDRTFRHRRIQGEVQDENAWVLNGVAGNAGYSGCSLWIDLDAEIAIVLLTNRTWPDRKTQLVREVRPAFHDAIRESI